MLINVSTRRFARAVRLPEGDIPSVKGDGVSKSAVSRRFVALSAAQLKTWMQGDLSKLDLLVIQIDGIHIEQDLVLLAAVGIDAEGNKHRLGVMEGATENAAVVQALLDNLVDRGLDPRFAGCSSSMALRWTGAAMQEAAKGFRRLKARKQLPILRAALSAIQAQQDGDGDVASKAVAA